MLFVTVISKTIGPNQIGKTKYHRRLRAAGLPNFSFSHGARASAPATDNSGERDGARQQVILAVEGVVGARGGIDMNYEPID